MSARAEFISVGCQVENRVLRSAGAAPEVGVICSCVIMTKHHPRIAREERVYTREDVSERVLPKHSIASAWIRQAVPRELRAEGVDVWLAYQAVGRAHIRAVCGCVLLLPLGVHEKEKTIL